MLTARPSSSRRDTTAIASGRVDPAMNRATIVRVPGACVIARSSRDDRAAARIAGRRGLAVKFPRRFARPHSVSMCGYRYAVGGTNVSLIVRGDAQRSRFSGEPALSLVPEARAPPNGCCPTTAPVGLSLT